MKNLYFEKKIVLFPLVIIILLLFFCSCQTVDYPKTFIVDFSSEDTPLMLNHVSDHDNGRQISAEVFSSRFHSSSTTTYGYITVTKSKKVTKDSIEPLSSQLIGEINELDKYIIIDNLQYVTIYKYLFGNTYNEYRAKISGTAFEE